MATYLPVLLGSVTAIPDDSTLSELPRGQVDYLSHEWREEDVWRSWRNMTRQKNEIANGVRLENASWRTWWKQRNGLKTVTPETLNWLKDSDVTWLYGPLHTADSQWTYTPKPSPSTAAALDLPSSPSPSLSQSSGSFSKKPILKHRSISELLTSDFPPSPLFSPPDSDDDNPPSSEQDVQDMSMGQSNILRPSLMRTKSDTHITRWGPNRAFRRDSPPRVVPSGAPSAAEMHSSVLQRPRAMGVVVPTQRRKHISFNTFVEQCIAIDKPKKRQPSWSGAYPQGGSLGYGFEDDGYDEDSEDGIIDEGEELLFGDVDDQTRTPSRPHPPTSHTHTPSHSPHSNPHNSPPSSSSASEEDEDDEVLEMRVRHTPATAHPILARSSSHSSSSTSSSSRSRPSKARSANYPSNGRHWRRGSGNSFMRSPSADKELVTIALIAPTILKTKADEDEHYPYAHSHPCPPTYPHPSSAPQHGKQGHSYGARDSPVELVYMPPSYAYSEMDDGDMDTGEENGTYQDSLTPRSQFLNQPLVASPNTQAQAPIHQEDILIDHFEVEQQSGSSIMSYDGEMQRHVAAEQCPRGPEVVVSSEDGFPERSRSRSRSKSRSRTPSPNTATTTASTDPSSPSAAVPVPRASASHQSFSSSLLSPPDTSLSRGRSVSSPSLSSQAEVQQSRGRSVTRTASFSDRDSVSAGSPLGSLSPEGTVGLGIGSVCIRDRDRDVRSERESRRDRGRERLKRGSGSISGSGSNSSLSPEDQRVPVQTATSQPLKTPRDSVPETRKYTSSSSSGSSTVSAVSVSTTRPPPRLVVDAKPVTRTDFVGAPYVPSSAATSDVHVLASPTRAQAMMEEQERISRQPTPANSPVLGMQPPMQPPLPSPKSTSSSPPNNQHRRKLSSPSRSPTRGSLGEDGQQGGTLVGRAVEIMSNAGAFFGSFWHTGPQAGAASP